MIEVLSVDTDAKAAALGDLRVEGDAAGLGRGPVEARGPYMCLELEFAVDADSAVAGVLDSLFGGCWTWTIGRLSMARIVDGIHHCLSSFFVPTLRSSLWELFELNMGFYIGCSQTCNSLSSYLAYVLGQLVVLSLFEEKGSLCFSIGR